MKERDWKRRHFWFYMSSIFNLKFRKVESKRTESKQNSPVEIDFKEDVQNTESNYSNEVENYKNSSIRTGKKNLTLII